VPLKKSLEVAIRDCALSINKARPNKTSKAVLALHNGIAFEMLTNPPEI
jgi:hypothetical protein